MFEGSNGSSPADIITYESRSLAGQLVVLVPVESLKWPDPRTLLMAPQHGIEGPRPHATRLSLRAKHQAGRCMGAFLLRLGLPPTHVRKVHVTSAICPVKPPISRWVVQYGRSAASRLLRTGQSSDYCHDESASQVPIFSRSQLFKGGQATLYREQEDCLGQLNNTLIPEYLIPLIPDTLISISQAGYPRRVVRSPRCEQIHTPSGRLALQLGHLPLIHGRKESRINLGGFDACS